MKNPSLDLYLWIIEQLQDEGMHTLTEGQNVPDNARNMDNAEVYKRLRAARLFNVPVSLAADTYSEVADYVSSLVKLGTEQELDPKKGTDLLRHRGTLHPFPSELPFEHCLLLYPWSGIFPDGSVPKSPCPGSVISAGIHLEDYELAARFGSDAVDEMKQFGRYSVIGHLVSQDGWVWEFLRWTRTSVNGLAFDPVEHGAFMDSLPPNVAVDVQAGFGATVMRNGDQWFSPLSMNPWAISSLIFMINDYKTLVLQRPGLSDKNKAKRFGKKRGLRRLRPPMYYGVMLRDNVIFTSAVESQFSEEDLRRCYQDFRSDVRGHERCRIRRGPLPLAPDARETLLGRGYTLYEHVMDLDGDDAKRLRERGLPLKERGEWLAIKTSWVVSYLKGPEDAPYRAAIRHLPLKPPTTWE